jgi:hypothetical protein
MINNKADLYQPVSATRVGPPPLVVRAVVTTNNDYVAGGMPQAATKVENYILLSALPTELQERVRTAVQALMSGM